MECRAYGICLDSQSRGYLGKDRKVSSAAGGNLSRMHKTQETAKESRLNFMYRHLRNRTLDVEPAKHFVLVTKREKRACRRCEEQGVETAALPARIIPKSLVSDRLIIDTVVNKYCDHLPLFRHGQTIRCAREPSGKRPPSSPRSSPGTPRGSRA